MTTVRSPLPPLLAAAVAVGLAAQTAGAPDLPPAGKAGQPLAPQTLAATDIAAFGGSTLISTTWGGVEVLGRLAKGGTVTERILSQSECPLKVTHVLVESANGARVRKKISRGTGQVTLATTANFDGTLISVVNVQTGNTTCSIFRNRTFSAGP